VVGRFIEPILKYHDRNQFEIFCYSDTTAVDELTNRLRASADHWWDTAGETDEQLARLVAADGVDILLDMTGHMDGNRLLMFARQPAPVQISHIGYPASSGVPQIQFRVTDRYLDPAPIVHSPETLLYMPDSFYLYANELNVSIQQPPMLQTGFTTFGSLNSMAKTSDLAIDLWAAALRAMPGSRFLLTVPPDGSVNDFIARRFELRGVECERLIFEPMRSYDQYLNLYNQIDIALDPQPYGGGITSCDALWMGVPIVTLHGKTSVGRIAATLLRNIGLDDLVTATLEEYAAIAARLAADKNRLTELRRTLRDRLAQSPLMDAKLYTRNLETLYRQAWLTSRASLERP
jgi:predicted O-linked N-acetylglucosamine transferase (SPINDLY family)